MIRRSQLPAAASTIQRESMTGSSTSPETARPISSGGTPRQRANSSWTNGWSRPISSTSSRLVAVSRRSVNRARQWTSDVSRSYVSSSILTSRCSRPATAAERKCTNRSRLEETSEKGLSVSRLKPSRSWKRSKTTSCASCEFERAASSSTIVRFSSVSDNASWYRRS